jgi:hypothetical protein
MAEEPDQWWKNLEYYQGTWSEMRKLASERETWSVTEKPGHKSRNLAIG